MEPKNTPEEPEEESISSKLLALLKDFPTAPTASSIEQWKSEHGDVFVSAFSEDEIFVFRSVSRRAHRQLQESSASSDEFEENLVKSCLLWTSVPDLDKKGGTIPTLFEQVVQNSNFMSPQLAASLVVKL